MPHEPHTLNLEFSLPSGMRLTNSFSFLKSCLKGHLFREAWLEQLFNIVNCPFPAPSSLSCSFSFYNFIPSLTYSVIYLFMLNARCQSFLPSPSQPLSVSSLRADIIVSWCFFVPRWNTINICCVNDISFPFLLTSW